MTDVSLDFEVVIDAPVTTAFDYCLDPRRIYAGDPTHEVTDAAPHPGGLGTTAQITTKTGPFTEQIALDYVEVIPNERIVFEAHPRMTFPRLPKLEIPGSLHTWTWTFEPDDGRTRLAVVVVEHDASRSARALDALTGHALSKGFTQEIRDRLGRIRAACETHTPSPAETT